MATENNLIVIDYESRIIQETAYIIDLLYGTLRPAIQTTAPRILFVGAGTGRVEIPLLEKLVRDNGNIQADHLDPCATFNCEFLHRCQEQDLGAHIRTSYLDRFEVLSLDKTYHAITAVHCFYDMKDLSHSISKFYDTLNPEGVGAIVIASRESGWDKFKRLVRPKLFHREMAFIFGEDIEEELRKHDYGYEVQVREYDLDVTDHVPHLDGSIRDKRVISFFLGKDYGNLTAEEKRVVHQCIDQVTMQSKGNYSMTIKNYIFTIKKIRKL